MITISDGTSAIENYGAYKALKLNSHCNIFWCTLQTSVAIFVAASAHV